MLNRKEKEKSNEFKIKTSSKIKKEKTYYFQRLSKEIKTNNKKCY